MAVDQLSLFESGSALPEGLRYASDLLTEAEEGELVAHTSALPFAPFAFRGYLGKRRVVSFGWRYGFDGFSPYAQPPVIDIAEGIPFAALTQYDVPSLYALKGDIVSRGVRAITGFEMPVFPKRRFQHGAVAADVLRSRIGAAESEYRRRFHARYA